VNVIGAMTLPGTQSYYLKKETICINSRSWFKTLEDKKEKKAFVTTFPFSVVVVCELSPN
jgi:hypothetical protein